MLRDKPYNITMKVKLVMSEDLLLLRFVALMTDTRRVKRCIIIYRAWMLTPDIIVILLTRWLPYVQYTKNRLTCENYVANYNIFQEHQLNSPRRFPVFRGVISNSRRFPGVVDTLLHVIVPFDMAHLVSSGINSSLLLWSLSPRIPRTVYRYFSAYPFFLSTPPVLHC